MKDLINRIISKLSKIQNDKILHSYVSTLITIISFMLFGLLSLDIVLTIGISIIFTLFIGFCKEYFIDYKLRNTQYSNEDMIANCVGIGIGTLINVLIVICMYIF